MVRAYGVRFPCARYLLLRVQPDRDADARRLLAVWTRRVTFGRHEPAAGADAWDLAHLNIAFTFAGLQALGVPTASLESFPDEFREGAALRSELLGDRGDSSCEHWEFGRSGAHVLLVVHASDERSLERSVTRLSAELQRAEIRW